MAQNDFLQFDETQENTLTQEAYSTDVQRVGGVSSGLARSALFNKVMRQASTFVAGFGNFISEKEIDILEDLTSVKTALTNLFTAKNVGVSEEVQNLLGADNVDGNFKNLLNIVESLEIPYLIDSYLSYYYYSWEYQTTTEQSASTSVDGFILAGTYYVSFSEFKPFIYLNLYIKLSAGSYGNLDYQIKFYDSDDNLITYCTISQYTENVTAFYVKKYINFMLKDIRKIKKIEIYVQDYITSRTHTISSFAVATNKALVCYK